MGGSYEFSKTYILRAALEGTVVCRPAKTLSHGDEVVSPGAQLLDRVGDNIVATK